MRAAFGQEGVHTRLDYRPVPPKKVLSVPRIKRSNLTHKADCIFVSCEPAFIPVGRYPRRISKLRQRVKYAVSEQGILAELKVDNGFRSPRGPPRLEPRSLSSVFSSGRMRVGGWLELVQLIRLCGRALDPVSDC